MLFPDGSVSLSKFNDRMNEIYRYLPYIKNRTTSENVKFMKTVGHTGMNISERIRKTIRDLGWDITDGRKFDYLIVPSKDHASAKTKLAKEKGVEIFTEDDFIAKFGSKVK